MKRGLNILLTISILIVCLVGAAACEGDSSDAAKVVNDITIHKGEVTHTETWETVDNKGVFTGYRSVVRGEAENVGSETIYRPYVQVTILGPEDAELGQDLIPLGIVEPGDKVKIKSEVISDTAYAVDFKWELIPWPMIATVEQLEASQWGDYYDAPSPTRWPMITGAIAIAIALALTVLLIIILRRRRLKRRTAGQIT